MPKNVEVALPLEVFHWLSGEGGSTFPHTLIIAEAGSKVTLVDYFESDRAEDGGFACAVNDLIVGPGAKVTYLCAQNWGEKVVSFQINSTAVERDANALSLHLNLGASYARLESLSRLVGTGGRSDMLAATVADTTQEFDQRTYQDHVEPHTTSDLLYKNALSDTAKTIFAGLIRVETEGPAHRCLPEGAQPDAQRRRGGKFDAGLWKSSLTRCAARMARLRDTSMRKRCSTCWRAASTKNPPKNLLCKDSCTRFSKGCLMPVSRRSSSSLIAEKFARMKIRRLAS